MIGDPFAWLSQDQEERAAPEQEMPIPAPTLFAAQPAAARPPGLSNIEKIMIASLLLNAVWFAVYFARSDRSAMMM
jgi:hypothetical protein